MKECMKSRPNPTAKFNYAWALIRSKEVSNSWLFRQFVYASSRVRFIDSTPRLLQLAPQIYY